MKTLQPNLKLDFPGRRSNEKRHGARIEQIRRNFKVKTTIGFQCNDIFKDFRGTFRVAVECPVDKFDDLCPGF